MLRQGFALAALLLAFAISPQQLRAALECDLNSDGQANVVDVQLGLNQALGISTCTSADLTQDGQCNIVDIQRLINAALGEDCRVGSGVPVSPPPPGPPPSSSPWVQSFSPARQLYVAPNGQGSGSINSPMSLSAAMSQAQPGDLFWLRTGTYSGHFTFVRSGTASSPIVWRAYTLGGDPERAKFVGTITNKGKWNWFWGLEVTDPTAVTDKDGVEFLAEGSRVINCIIHDIADWHGIGAWNTGSGQLVYGTVIHRTGFDYNRGGTPPAHSIYTQNDFDNHGYKYFVQMMLLDSMDAAQNSYTFHAYSTNGHVSGMWVQDSVFDRGRFVIGHEKSISPNNVVRGSYFHDMTQSDSSISLGWKGPSEIEFTNNYLVKSTVVSRRLWGSGENTFPQDNPNKFSGNSLFDPFSGYHLRVTTAAMVNGSITTGSPAIRNADVWENNTYGGSFKASLNADGSNSSSITGLSGWRNETKDARESSTSGFDLNSSTVSNPTTNKVALLRNEYEAGRGHLVIYNWANAGTTAVNLSSVVGSGKSFKIRDARDFYGTPVLSGTYQGGLVNVPTGGRFLALYVVTSAP